MRPHIAGDPRPVITSGSAGGFWIDDYKGKHPKGIMLKTTGNYQMRNGELARKGN